MGISTKLYQSIFVVFTFTLFSCAQLTTKKDAPLTSQPSGVNSNTSELNPSEATQAAKDESLDDDVNDENFKPEQVELSKVLGQMEGEGTPEAEGSGDIEEEEAETADATIPPDVKEDTVSHYDFPVVVNEPVKKWINYFQTRGRHYFELYLTRSHRFMPEIRQLFKSEGLPEDLAYLAFIESGFSVRAYSHAHAVGHWQFIAPTARRYGLRVNWWIDERRDPDLSAKAAARYLKDLYAMFDSWYLAAAGYNAGENKILRAIKRYRTRNFWELTRNRYLRPETKNYVPKLLAAILMAKNPQKYGFDDKNRHVPDDVEYVDVQGSVNIAALSRSLGIDYDRFLDLNPMLRRPYTPPDQEITLRVPKGHGDQVAEAFTELLNDPTAKRYVELNRSIASNFREESHQRRGTYVVRRGDTIGAIARRYRVNAHHLMRANGIRNASKLSVGKRLRIPGRAVASISLDSGASAAKDAGVYVVRRGDTLSVIARKFRISLNQLLRINRLTERSRIYVGQRIKVPFALEGTPG